MTRWHIPRSAVTAVAVLLATASSAFAQDTITQRIEVSGTAELTLANVAGNITVEGVDGNAIVIEAAKRGGSQAARDQVQVEISERGDRVEVRTRYPRNNRERGRVAVDFAVQVPSGGEVSVTSVSGTVTVERVDGETRAESVSGDVRITAVAELTRAKSVSGDIVLTDATAERDLQAETVSGSIEGDNVATRRLEMSTVSGDVSLVDVQSSRADISSVSGNIVYEGMLAEDGRYDFQVHSGRVTLRIPDTVGFELDASSFSGSIRSDLPLETESIDTGRRRTLEGRFGDGSAFLDITSFSGDIVIERR